MLIDKKEYIVRQISKTRNKRYENYIVCRIINLLDDLSVKFITQQPVIRSDGRRSLTDLYFPQLDLHVEVDELYHKRQIEADIDREADIINITGHKIERIDASKNIKEIHKQIDRIVGDINEMVQRKSFIPWDLESEFNPKTYIDKGYIDLVDKVSFRRIVDALNCFGLSYTGYQRALATHPIESDKTIWFPKLYENADWDNKISLDGKFIYEKRKRNNTAFIKDFVLDDRPNMFKRIVFARVKDSLGIVMYRFKGVFEANKRESQKKGEVIYEKISDRVKTYSGR